MSRLNDIAGGTHVTDGELAWEALADPTRRSILRILAEQGELPAGQIAAQITTVGRTAVSGQLRILRTAGLVRERRDAQRRLYSVQPESTDEVVRFLAAIYRGSLDVLKRQVEEGQDSAEAGSDGAAHAG
jgi:ArsR family transcriptional regulator, arsenate/arsenite/antimonite-responsive transcriptional repressor